MRVLLLLGLLAGLPAHAEIFVCEDGGRKTFSQQPCGKDARGVALNNEVSRITLPRYLNANSAAKLCGVMAGAWEMVAADQRREDGGNMDQQRLVSYLRERISNYNAIIRLNPDLGAALEAAADRLLSQVSDRPESTPDSQARFQSACVTDVMYTVR